MIARAVYVVRFALEKAGVKINFVSNGKDQDQVFVQAACFSGG